MEREWDGESKGERVNPLKVFFCVFLLFFFVCQKKNLNLEFLPHFFFCSLLRSQVELSKKKIEGSNTQKKNFLISFQRWMKESSSRVPTMMLLSMKKDWIKIILWKLLSFPSCFSFLFLSEWKKKSKNALYDFPLCNLNPSTATEHTHIHTHI